MFIQLAPDDDGPGHPQRRHDHVARTHRPRLLKLLRVHRHVQGMSRVANDHDRDQNFGLDCGQQSIPIDFWLNRPQLHDRDIV